MRVADYLMSRLADHGIANIFLLPGGGAMHLNDALACEKRIAAIPCHHEQACGIAAEAWGRIQESFGVAMVTTGPGATNIVTPVAGAWIESVPMLIISGQVKRADRLAGRPLRQGGVQEVDIIPMVKTITKYAVCVDDPLQIRYHLERALFEMRSGRPGPVWLDIPLDVQASLIEPDQLAGFTLPVGAEREHEALAQAIVQTKKLLAAAKRPLILAGHGVRLAEAADDFKRLVEKLQIPVVTTWNALDLLPFDHHLNIGRPGVVALRPPNFAIQNCDLLISIGSRLDNIITAYNPRGFARAAQKIVVDVDANELDRIDMDIAVKACSDAKLFISALAEEDLTVNCSDWIAHCNRWKQRYPVNDGWPFESEGPISHYHFASSLSDAMPNDTLIATGSSGLAVEVFYTIFRNKSGQRVFLTSGLGSMGYGLPAAIGACLAHQRQPTVAVESDGSLQLNLQELATLKANDLPICLIIMNNGGYCSIRNTQRNYFQGRYLGTDPESGLWMPDIEQIAKAYNLAFLRIDNANALTESLHTALELPRPCIVDVRLIEAETLAPKAAAVPQADGSMISMPLEDMTPLLPLSQLEEEMLIPLLPISHAATRQ